VEPNRADETARRNNATHATFTQGALDYPFAEAQKVDFVGWPRVNIHPGEGQERLVFASGSRLGM